MITQTLDYTDGAVSLEAFVAYQQSVDAKPLVLVAHDWSGRRQFAMDAAARLAELGYVGFALDMYGKGVVGADGDVELNSSLMNPLASDRNALRARMLAALNAGLDLPQADPNKVAAIGYCFGGMCVLELARSGADVRGVVSIHGILASGDADNEPVKAKVLCLHGHEDPMVPPEQVLKFEQEMTAAGADWQLHAYGNTLHGFTNPAATNAASGTLYNEAAQKRAYLSMQNFLAEVFA
jgi:dienelactone hydrolase